MEVLLAEPNLVGKARAKVARRWKKSSHPGTAPTAGWVVSLWIEPRGLARDARSGCAADLDGLAGSVEQGVRVEGQRRGLSRPRSG